MSFLDIAKEDPDFKVIVKFGQYTQESGQNETANILTANPVITMIASNYTENSKGAIQALEEAKKSGVKVYDYGGCKDAIALLKEGKIELTARLLPLSWFSTATEQLRQAYNGEKVERAIPLGSDEPLVTDANVDTLKPPTSTR